MRGKLLLIFIAFRGKGRFRPVVWHKLGNTQLNVIQLGMRTRFFIRYFQHRIGDRNAP
ncbi:Uncharacterised protein [Vibrio cholerae]|nr:Uncharacterised protein [Vibrio cholerae]CSB44935.1 Uncharacterised protein [Vibrio cholerae]